MEAKIVYVVYGSHTEISELIAFLVRGEWAFHYSGEYLYFPNDPTELIKEAGMDLKVDTEHWIDNCFGFKSTPRESIQVERTKSTIKADTTIKVNDFSAASRYLEYLRKQGGVTEIRDQETTQKGGRKFRMWGNDEIVYIYHG